MATMASMQSSPSSTDKASVVYTTYSAEDHWREGNQEGPRRIHACTDLLRQKLLTAADLPNQARAPSWQQLPASTGSTCCLTSMHKDCRPSQHAMFTARRCALYLHTPVP